jgi:acyl carrier protein
MGLDTVELVMEVEEAFDVRIPDNLASQIVTVGDLYDFIISARGETPNPRNTCLSAATFFMIRQGFVRELDAIRERIRPDASVDAALPSTDRRRLWKRLSSSLDLKLPGFCRPKWLVNVSTTLAGLAVVLISVLVYREWGWKNATLVAFLSLLPLGVTGCLLTAPFATQPSPNWQTFRGLTHVVLAHNYAKISGMFESWHPTDVWDALQIIIVEQLGVPPEAVTRDASFVKDLGAD